MSDRGESKALFESIIHLQTLNNLLHFWIRAGIVYIIKITLIYIILKF